MFTRFIQRPACMKQDKVTDPGFHSTLFSVAIDSGGSSKSVQRDTESIIIMVTFTQYWIKRMMTKYHPWQSSWGYYITCMWQVIVRVLVCHLERFSFLYHFHIISYNIMCTKFECLAFNKKRHSNLINDYTFERPPMPKGYFKAINIWRPCYSVHVSTTPGWKQSPAATPQLNTRILRGNLHVYA